MDEKDSKLLSSKSLHPSTIHSSCIYSFTLLSIYLFNQPNFSSLLFHSVSTSVGGNQKHFKHGSMFLLLPHLFEESGAMEGKTGRPPQSLRSCFSGSAEILSLTFQVACCVSGSAVHSHTHKNTLTQTHTKTH